MPDSLRHLDDIPGPRGWPLVGNALQIDRSQLHRQLEKWSELHGPVFRIRLGPSSLLVVAGHERIATMLRDRPDGFSRTRRLREIGLEMGLKPGLFGSDGDDWRRQRRMVMSAFDPAHVKAWFSSLAAVALRLRGRWRGAARAGQPIDLQADLMRYTVDAVSGLAFGTQFNTLEADDEIIQRHLDRIFPALFNRSFSILPLWRFWRSKADLALAASITEVNLAIDGFVRDARARLDADPARRLAPANLLEALICAADADDDLINDDIVAGNVMTMLLAGEDTTANTLAWMISLLAAHPDKLAKAREEVLRITPDPALVDFESIARLEYLEACAHETMRLKPVAPILLGEALHDRVIDDVTVPRGTVVIALMRRDATDDAQVPEAGRFLPERWLTGDGPGSGALPASQESGTFRAASTRRISMPFGAGPRICPGRYLALLEMRLAMATLLSSFEIDRVATPDGKPAREHLAFTMAPMGLRMWLRERP